MNPPPRRHRTAPAERVRPPDSVQAGGTIPRFVFRCRYWDLLRGMLGARCGERILVTYDQGRRELMAPGRWNHEGGVRRFDKVLSR